jgi:hypothetical protein
MQNIYSTYCTEHLVQYSLFERPSLVAYARLTKSCEVLLLRLVGYFLKGLH